MIALQVIPVVLSLWVLAAHFLRTGNILLVTFLALLPLLLFVRRSWVARLVQVVLLLGSLEWLRTLAIFARMRVQMEQPVLRLAIILGVVALVTMASALLFQVGPLRRLYGLNGEEAGDGVVAE